MNKITPDIQPPLKPVIAVEETIRLQATQSGLAVGPRGHTPVIGGNGNWWIDGDDTGVSATGEPMFEYDGTERVRPTGGKTIDMNHLSGVLDPGEFV